MIAYAWANGRIELGDRLPAGALPICKGPAARLRQVISATSRLAYDGKTQLVPGLPEAGDGLAAVDALITYCLYVERCMEADHGA